MPDTVELGEFLFTRLRQLGVDSVHGVPGDFNLELLDYVEPSGLHWVGSCNELNAAYAADGYARIKGLGAIVTTFGVGELSAVNAIAGAYAERAPVVHIVGTPRRDVQDNRIPVHHTFNDGDHRRFVQVHSSITVAQACLRDPLDSPGKIDAALQQCLIHSRPVYIEIPLDMAELPVPRSLLDTPLMLPEPVMTPKLSQALDSVLDRIRSSKQPCILVDGESRAYDMLAEVQQFVDATKWPTWSSTFGKGLVDETRSNFHGVYMGLQKPEQKSFIDSSDLVVVFGPHFSTTNSFQLSAIPPPATSVLFASTSIRVGSTEYRDLPPKFFLTQLLDALHRESAPVFKYDAYPELETPRSLAESIGPTKPGELVNQKEFYLRFSSFLRPGDVVLAETGTAGYGAREFVLPAGCRFFGPSTWLSIGYMLPAAQGAALAQRDKTHSMQNGNGNGNGHGQTPSGRTILLIGDGSLQVTVQELSTIIRENLNVVVLVVNNNGYTIERCIHGQNQGYNDISTWRYLEAPKLFGAPEGKRNTATIRTWADLEALGQDKNFTDGEGLRMVEVFMERDDAPIGLLDLLDAQLARAKVKKEREEVKKELGNGVEVV
jgi:pyruvate decarboxylase